MENKLKRIDEIFSNKALFEREVLDIKSQKDKSEVMHFLSNLLVKDILKEHINFLYVEKMSDFTLKHIVNILFKEIANEWVFYAIDILDCSKEEALEQLADARVKFIHKLVLEYYKDYKDYIFEDIADTFIELLASMNPDSKKILLVNAVINSDLIANRSIIGINSFNQLYRRVKSAKNLKSADLSYLQAKVSDILKELKNDKISVEKKESLLTLHSKYEKKVINMQETKLEHFDASLQRVKRAIFNSLKNEIFKN
ncbi:MAG: hypothetical protein K8R44_04135 [Sulfurimonas sp.]|nr:hypothetical protein [Sulfurimonas sp.]